MATAINLFDTAYKAVTRHPIRRDVARIDMCATCWRLRPVAHGETDCIDCR